MGLSEEQMIERDDSLNRLKITTYKDKKGYVFISYKSDNWKKVFEEKVFELQDNGLRVYSDKNFNDTNHPWLDDMDKNIRYSSAVMMFISPEYLKSYATLIELLTAIKYEKEIVPVYFSRRDNIFDELEDDVDLEDDIVKMEPSETARLEALMQLSDSKYANSINDIWNNYLSKRSLQRFCVRDIVDAFKTILCKNAFKDNLFYTDLEALKNTIKDASRNAKLSEVFEEQSENVVEKEQPIEKKTKVIAEEEQPTVKIESSTTGKYYKNAGTWDLQCQEHWAQMLEYLFGEKICTAFNNVKVDRPAPMPKNCCAFRLKTSKSRIEMFVNKNAMRIALIVKRGTDLYELFAKEKDTIQKKLEACEGDIVWNLECEAANVSLFKYNVDIVGGDKAEQAVWYGQIASVMYEIITEIMN